MHLLFAQTATPDDLSQQIQRLTEAMSRTQAQLEQSQHQLDELRSQLRDLESRLPQTGAATTSSSATAGSSSEATARAIEELREHQSIEDSQIATQEQTKVESESKYPVRITGLVLFNGFVNTGAVDMASTPTVALPGSGSTGASFRQTVLGVDARGPHLFGASTRADLSVDFDGTQAVGSAPIYSGYYSSNSMLLRLRTAHASLDWQHTKAYFSLDRPILTPDMPSSLTAVAVPALAWSGNLWTWNPQVGLNHDLDLFGTRALLLQAALIDVGDAPLSPPYTSSSISTVTPPGTGEQSRWPGVEARIAILGQETSRQEQRAHLGVGGYFAPHYSNLLAHGFDSWAGTLDAGLPLPAGLELTGSFYRGQALGGLGGGAYKDFAYKIDPDTNSYYFRPLDDVGGWSQLKERFSERLEFNAALGIDNAFTGELRHYAVAGNTLYQNLARNRTYTGNVIYSPSAYLLFSLEYRHLKSSPVVGLPSGSNIIGLGAGYKF